jgi:hypothetical protein
MSPFEAYLAADWAVASKILNPEFSRTDVEENRARLMPPPMPKVGLHVSQPNPRVEEFVNHIVNVTARKWRDVDSAMLSVADAMEKSRVR